MRRHDYVSAYVDDLPAVIDVDAIRTGGVRLGVDPLGGASLAYWAAIADRHGLDLTIVNDAIDPTFAFVPVDWDGRIRMDCSSPYAMARLTDLRDDFDVAFANDPDADRHGIVTPRAGLLNPNHHLAACIAYLFGGNRDWPSGVGVGKTLVSSSIIDRVTADLGARSSRCPSGSSGSSTGCSDGSLGFGGEESAGRFVPAPGRLGLDDRQGRADPLPGRGGDDRTRRRRPGRGLPRARRAAWRPGLPAGRRRGHAGGEGRARAAVRRAGRCRMSLPASRSSTSQTAAPGNGAPIGRPQGDRGKRWFAARPSGTEDVYKVYAESFLGQEHLERILAEAERIVQGALAGGASAQGPIVSRMAEISIGLVLGGYRIEGVAGEGGMGRVYRADADRPQPAGGAQGDHAGAGRTRRTSGPASRARRSWRPRSTTPTSIPVYEAGEADGRLFIAMRWVDGTDLRSVILREGRLDPARAVEIVEQVAAALDAAHRGGLVHRDVKPANVMLTSTHGREHVYLTDFGLTKRAESVDRPDAHGRLRGHPRLHAARSRFKGQRPDARTDVYALGCLLFQALTGTSPLRPGHRGREDVRASPRSTAERAGGGARHAGGLRCPDRQGAREAA